MINKDIKLPCGARLTVQQADDVSYILMCLESDRPLKDFMRFQDNRVIVSVDPDNIQPLIAMFTPETRLNKIFKFLKFVVLGEKS